MRVDQNAKHAEAFVQLDEAHPAHISRQIINDPGVPHPLLTRIPFLEIKLYIFHSGKMLIPILDRLEIDGTNVFVTLPQQISNQVTADKSPSTSDKDFVRLHIHFDEGKG